MTSPEWLIPEVKKYARSSPVRALKPLVCLTGMTLTDAKDIVKTVAGGEVSDEELERLIVAKTVPPPDAL